MSDQVSEFTGQVISELCDLLGVTKIRTSPYHPQTNSAVESTSDTQKNDSQNGPREKGQMALTLRTYTNCLQCYMVTDNRLLTLFLNVWVLTKITSRPSIPDHEVG